MGIKVTIPAKAALPAMISAFVLTACQSGSGPGRPADMPNILFLTADDLNYNSVGSYGCQVPGITPHLDRLAGEGIRFNHAHVNISVCQPSRQSMLTGMYPHSNGGFAFFPIDSSVITLNEILREAGYLNGILGKEKHYQPAEKFCWDYLRSESDLASGRGIGRDPEKYYREARAFIEMALSRKRPFFLHANAHDPHRPFAGSEAEQKAWGDDLPAITRMVGVDEVEVHGMLPDLDEIRRETAQYYTSVFRCDETIGAVLRALEESGAADETLVVFLSDNGMSFPYAKTNCYLNSTKTPLIIKWPGHIQEGMVDSIHMVSGIDLMPTFLEAAGLPLPDHLQGRSLMGIFSGVMENGRDHVFTEFHMNFARDYFPMRSVITSEYSYIANFWSDGTMVFQNESKGGLSFPAMVRAGESDPVIRHRVDFYNLRTSEEFYDNRNDPDAMVNLIGEPGLESLIAEFRTALIEHMTLTGDTLLRRLEAVR